MIGLVRLASRLDLIIASAGFALIVAVVVFNVLARYLFSRSLVFTEEIAYFGFAYSVFFGTSHLYRTHGLVSVSLFFDMLPVRPRRVLHVFMMALMAAASAYFTYLTYVLAAGSWIRRTAFLELPYAYLYLAPLTAFALMSAYSLWFAFRLIRGEEIEEALQEEAL